MAENPASAATVKRRATFWTETIPKLLNYIVLVLSLGLIIFISWDTYKDRDYLENPVYMKYQFIVCMVFLTEYFYRFWLAPHKLRFFFLTLIYLIVSIPYLNIIEYYNIAIDHTLLTYLCFIPILRGLIALAMVVVYVTKNLATTVFAAYMLVLGPVVYMSGLIFYVAEKAVNPGVKNLWYAMWWAGMNVSTIGCNINPVTGTGMFLGLMLSLMGIIMLPLFTVYSGAVIERYNKKLKATNPLKPL